MRRRKRFALALLLLLTLLMAGVAVVWLPWRGSRLFTEVAAPLVQLPTELHSNDFIWLNSKTILVYVSKFSDVKGPPVRQQGSMGTTVEIGSGKAKEYSPLPADMEATLWRTDGYTLTEYRKPFPTGGKTASVWRAIAQNADNKTRPVEYPNLLGELKVREDGPVLSPEGKRIAWVVKGQHTAFWPALLRHFMPSYRNATSEVVKIYVSNTNGSDLREIAYTPYMPVDSDRIQQKRGFCFGLAGMQWTPDGKHLSFLYGDTLWSLPVE